MNFRVDDYFETRNDNPNLRSYRVFLNNNTYLLYYDKDQLREVYFMSVYPNYFMGVRADLKTISHYYIKDGGDFINRYENGVHDRTYRVLNKEITTCVVDGKERIYTAQYRPVTVNEQKLYVDLTQFLKKFRLAGMTSLFSPKEP